MSLLITGATGKTGRYIVEDLAARGVRARALVRNPAAAGWLRDAGMDPVPGDMDRPATLGAALAGIEQVVLLAANSPDQVRVEREFIDAARAAGVRRIVKFSAIAAGGDNDYRFARWHGEAEAHLRASGLEWSIVRPGFFMQNFQMMAAPIRAEGRFYLPACDEPIGLVDVRDAAAVTVACLLDPRQTGRIRTVTSTDSLSMAECATRMTAILGRRIEYVPLSPEDFRGAMVGAGAPDWLADGMNELYASARLGNKDILATSVQRLLGRAPIGFDRFVADHAEAFNP